jgi:hypothetical protein
MKLLFLVVNRKILRAVRTTLKITKRKDVEYERNSEWLLSEK